MAKRRDVPGNAMASRAEVERILVRLGSQLSNLDHVLEQMTGDDVWVRSLTIRLWTQENEEHLVVVKADTAEGAVVAFHSAATLAELVDGLVNRCRNKSLRWKEDQYAK